VVRLHDWVRGQIDELLKKIEQNDATIDRLQVENTEIQQIVTELRSIK
jgi:hypothetical protein